MRAKNATAAFMMCAIAFKIRALVRLRSVSTLTRCFGFVCPRAREIALTFYKQKFPFSSGSFDEMVGSFGQLVIHAALLTHGLVGNTYTLCGGEP